MNCPRCNSESFLWPYRARYSRQGKRIYIKSKRWNCTSCRTILGPFTFLTPEMADANDAKAELEWEIKFKEKMPPDFPMNRIRKLMRTEDGKAKVAKAFGVALKKEAGKKPQGE